MFPKRKKEKETIDIKNLFPARKIHNNKYFRRTFQRGSTVNQNINYSCTYHNHIPAINP